MVSPFYLNHGWQVKLIHPSWSYYIKTDIGTECKDIQDVKGYVNNFIDKLQYGMIELESISERFDWTICYVNI